MPFGSSHHRAPTLALTAGDGSGTRGNKAEGNGIMGRGSDQAGMALGVGNTSDGLSPAQEDVGSGGAEADADAAANAVVATHALRGCAGLAAVATGAAQLLAWPGLLLDLLQIAAMPQVRGLGVYLLGNNPASCVTMFLLYANVFASVAPGVLRIATGKLASCATE
eukprot:1157956-Pelagomonas_calceolata.AAC.10